MLPTTTTCWSVPCCSPHSTRSEPTQLYATTAQLIPDTMDHYGARVGWRGEGRCNMTCTPTTHEDDPFRSSTTLQAPPLPDRTSPQEEELSPWRGRKKCGKNEKGRSPGEIFHIMTQPLQLIVADLARPLQLDQPSPLQSYAPLDEHGMLRPRIPPQELEATLTGRGKNCGENEKGRSPGKKIEF